MKKSIISIALSATLATSALVSTQASAEVASIEGLSANVGLTSQYIFRGIAQTDTASASAGLDYENSGFYAGIWTADVQDGLEIDYYAGYGLELDNGIGLSIGYTLYAYTGDFDTEYQEVNLGFTYDVLSVSYNKGSREDAAGDQDYDFLSATLEKDGFYVTYGTWGDEFEGDYLEFGYGTEIGGFDAGVSIVKSDEDLDLTGEGDSTIVFNLSKSF